MADNPIDDAMDRAYAPTREWLLSTRDMLAAQPMRYQPPILSPEHADQYVRLVRGESDPKE